MQLERLQKIIAHAGVASRREAESMIRDGRMPTPEDAENAYRANTNQPAPTPEDKKRERDRQLQALLVRRK